MQCFLIPKTACVCIYIIDTYIIHTHSVFGIYIYYIKRHTYTYTHTHGRTHTIAHISMRSDPWNPIANRGSKTPLWEVAMKQSLFATFALFALAAAHVSSMNASRNHVQTDP